MPAAHPVPYSANEQSPHLSVAYVYVIRHEDGQRAYYSNFDRPITVINIPEEICPEEEMEFLPANIKHGPITNNDKFEERSMVLAVASNNEDLKRYFLMAAATRLKVWIIRLSKDVINDAVIDFTGNAFVAEAGILSRFSFQGSVIMAQVTPEPFFVNFSIPRVWFQRNCNHVLGGAGCRINLELFKLETTISAVDPANKTVTLAARKSGGDETFFEAGFFRFGPSGQRYSIYKSSYVGTTETLLSLGFWNPELEVGGAVVAYAGCRHTPESCQDKFNNAANYGGFPWIPSRNPVTDGAG